MKKIALLCAAGMSTGMLVNKMREEAKKQGYECEINAYSVSRAAEVGQTADCLLIGPQVKYELAKVRSVVPDKPVEVIDMVAYGRLDGAKVLATAKKLIGE